MTTSLVAFTAAELLEINDVLIAALAKQALLNIVNARVDSLSYSGVNSITGIEKYVTTELRETAEQYVKDTLAELQSRVIDKIVQTSVDVAVSNICAEKSRNC